MTLTLRRAGVASMALAAVVAVGACGADDGAQAPEQAETTTGPDTSAAGSSEASSRAEAVPRRTATERDFLDELSGFGFPTDMTASTTVEVGIGICQSIADGADDDTILDSIRPLTSAIAAQDPEMDTAEVGRGLVDASRTHLCD